MGDAHGTPDKRSPAFDVGKASAPFSLSYATRRPFPHFPNTNTRPQTATHKSKAPFCTSVHLSLSSPYSLPSPHNHVFHPRQTQTQQTIHEKCVSVFFPSSLFPPLFLFSTILHYI